MPTLCADAQQKAHDYLFWDFQGYGGQLAVRMGRWKGIKQGLKKNPQSPLELYDLENDISESTDVAQQHPNICAEIEKIMRMARDHPNASS